MPHTLDSRTGTLARERPCVIICTQRRQRVGAAFATAVLTAVGIVAGGGTPASAAPNPTPAQPSGDDTVLIVHVARSATLRGVAGDLAGLHVRHRLSDIHALSVRVPRGDASAAAARLRQLPGVASVERGVTRHFFDVTPNDPLFATKQQSYLKAVNAPAAWSTQKGSTSLNIAVIDSGVDVKHPDLNGKIAGTYDAAAGSGDDASDVTDDVGHGTFVAGVAAARTGNHTGVAGAGWNTKILAVKIADPQGDISIDDEVRGIQWAVNHGADVINLSLGGADRSSAEAAAIAAAQQAGVVVVAAAGNEADTIRSYPAAYPGVIAVGATDSAHHARADFSNHGSWVTVAAPGVNIFSSVPTDSQMWGRQPGRYTHGDGTSFSTPLVAGEAALLRAQNPDASVAQIRHAIVASARGYRHLGLGAGQVDFASALRHVPPVGAPSSISVTPSAGRLAVTVHAAAPRVALRLDHERARDAVTTSGGIARLTLGTWGYANGEHTVYAYACTAYGECGSKRLLAAVTIANPLPAITSPSASSTLTGRVTVAGSAPGGALELLVDGHRRGATRRAPYRFALSTSALTDGSHVLRVRSCSPDGRLCAGPLSPPVTVRTDALHPEITALTPTHLSPNGDSVHDSARLRFRLAERETVHVRVLDAAGAVVRSYALGTLGAGPHAWTWRPRTAAGRTLKDGRYAVVLDTARGARAGWVEHVALIDTRAPHLARPATSTRHLYPRRDGYRDDLTLRTRLGEPGRLTVRIKAGDGRTVRTLHAKRPAGPAEVTWNGRTAGGRIVPAGTYRAQVSLTDAAGNTARRAPVTLTVSAKRLRSVVRFVTVAASGYRHAGGTASCAAAKRAGSSFAGGLVLTNRCPSNGFDLAFADYSFRLPAAVSYERISFAARGHSSHRPAELTAAFSRSDGSLEIPAYVTVRRSATSWYHVAGVPAAHHVGADRRVRVSLLLDSFYSGPSDFDAAVVRLRVRMTVLR